VKLVFLGKFADIAGSGELALTRPPGLVTLTDLRAWLASSLPGLNNALKGRGVAIIVNQTIVHDPQHPVGDDDEVAFLPPMSGG
jgi:molybdopterin converting factor small subunit